MRFYETSTVTMSTSSAAIEPILLEGFNHILLKKCKWYYMAKWMDKHCQMWFMPGIVGQVSPRGFSCLC